MTEFSPWECGGSGGEDGEKRAITRSPDETRRFGEQLGKSLRPGDVVALIGTMGSGKTCLAQGICRGLGVVGYVSSPSFIIINEYCGRLPVYHLDLYRLRNVDEFLDLGYEEYLYGEGVSIIEWAEKVYDLLPPRRIELFIERVGGDEREIAMKKLITA